jgi:uncharacterized FlgJ-related protein
MKNYIKTIFIKTQEYLLKFKHLELLTGFLIGITAALSISILTFEKKPNQTILENIDKIDTLSLIETFDTLDSPLDTVEYYPGVKERPKSKRSRYDSVGLPRNRKWLYAYELRGKHVSGKKKKAFRKWKKNHMAEFIDYVANAAIDERQHFPKILPSVYTAQAILESAYGTSRLSVQGNNLFGHKYRGKDKTFIIVNDDSPTDRFTVYKSTWYSIRSHSHLMKRRYTPRVYGNPKYRKNWYRALCGGLTVKESKAYHAKGHSLYATSCMTDPCYVDKLEYIVKKHKLWKYDK